MLTFFPAAIGQQDIAGLLANQPAVAVSWQRHVMASPFGTIHAATFSFARPVGTAMPLPLGYDQVSLSARNPLGDPSKMPPLEFPTVDRSKKGDALMPRPKQEMPAIETPAAEEAAPQEQTANEEPPTADTVELPYKDLPPAELVAPASSATPPGDIYFGIDPLAGVQSLVPALTPWAPGEEPVLMGQPDVADPDIKLAALAPAETETIKEAAKPAESIAPKGEVTGEGKRPMSPAERLKLAPDSKARAKAEKCLANAVYFESRSEPIRGQIAVAQVVMNRVFSGKYPNDVCGVVYQNAHRHLSCQFTFACDGIPDIVTEPELWKIAKRIARDTLDGKLWMPEVAKSTHYHATYVYPVWRREMKRLVKLGEHLFYRPRAWGDGSDAPIWGDADATRKEADAMEKGRPG